jgi:hypothetical protein
MDDIERYFKKYNNIESLILENKLLDEEKTLINLKEDLHDINKYKHLVNKSKSIMIKINKSKYILQNKKKIEKIMNDKIEILDHNNLHILHLIINKYKTYFDIDYNLLNYKIENIIQNVHTFKHLDFYSIINYKKTNKNNLEKLLYSINFKNSFLFYPKIIFLENYDIIDSYQSIILFLKKFNYNYINKTNKNLKRGFIFQLHNNNTNNNYILKFQPNKSFIEIIINKYLSKHTYLNNYILFPEYFFINKNNSYFYIIEKYDCDLFQYIKHKKEYISDDQIVFIIKHLISVIYYLHKLHIIYSDIKLENFVVNIKNNEIDKIKLIDFDVSIFNVIPPDFSEFEPKIIKLLNNKKPRGTKYYMSPNKVMDKSNDIYSIGVFIIILLYKNIIKILNENKENISENLLSKIYNRLTFYKNKLENDKYKKKLIKYIFRIYNDKRFNHYWTHKISIKYIYTCVKKCIDHSITSSELFDDFITSKS